ncbi:uncharacterized membrane protein YcaP (DUF421 family) [Spirosoma lacussanchae]|uniref:DUF421 domain-containing protein n=1 Tax=Spirosoma lacussanchae TaxID=1884249 RepID=UPI001109E901|nr:YetF domain-containing protein [Spirosoma lacussanchae]
MDKLLEIDWDSVFIPSSSVAEIFVRGTLTYLVVLAYFRAFRRGTGQLNISDLLLVTLVSDAAQNAMAGTYESVTEGVVLVGTLVFWDYLINWLGYRSVFFDRVASPEPALLIKDGVLQRQTMKRELLTEDELKGILREKGVEDYTTVKLCYLEGSGNVSVIEKK